MIWKSVDAFVEQLIVYHTDASAHTLVLFLILDRNVSIWVQIVSDYVHEASIEEC